MAFTQTIHGQIQSGIIWEDENYLSLPQKSNSVVTPEYLPIRHSLKTSAPKVVNQIGAGTSSAWSSVWYGQTIAKALSCLQVDAKEITSQAFAPMYVYRKANPEGDCFKPIGLTQILQLATTVGSPHFSEFSNLCPLEIPDHLESSAYSNRLNGFVKLFNPFDTRSIKIAAIKNAIQANHPVVLGMITPPSFSLAKEFWQPREQPDTTMNAQALCVVGYDDQKFGGAIEVVNQWGKHWGNEGYTWIRYEDLAKYARYGVELLFTADCVALSETTAVLYDDKGKVITQFDVDNKLHQLSKPLGIGTKFKMEIRGKTGFFAYLLIKDGETALVELFPTATVYPYVPLKITLPDKDTFYRLEGMPQTNELYLIISNRQLDMEDIKAKLENGKLITHTGAQQDLSIALPFKDFLKIARIDIDQN